MAFGGIPEIEDPRGCGKLKGPWRKLEPGTGETWKWGKLKLGVLWSF